MLDDKDRRLLRLFASIVLGEWSEVTRLRQAAPPGEPDRAWREAVVQTHVFAGFPRTVEAYGCLDQAGGLGALDADERLSEPEQPQRGRALFERIYGEHAPRVRAFLERGHPDFAAWIEGHAYGRVLTRPGLSPAKRELLAVVALAVLGQERQLASHARGAVRCGAEASDVLDALDVVGDLIAPERLERARAVLEHFAR